MPTFRPLLLVFIKAKKDKIHKKYQCQKIQGTNISVELAQDFR